MFFDTEREAMVRDQLHAREITDSAVLDAMAKIERHLFVSEKDQKSAYLDRPVYIGEDQTISQPYIVALMTQLLGLKGDERVLEIGTGSGYQTAVLAELASEVYTVERFKSLMNKAKKRLQEIGYKNIYYRTGDGTVGWKDNMPYDRIIVTAAAPHIPKTLFSQLSKSGRMIIPVGNKFLQDLKLVVKDEAGDMKVESCGGCVFVPLIGKDGWQND